MIRRSINLSSLAFMPRSINFWKLIEISTLRRMFKGVELQVNRLIIITGQRWYLRFRSKLVKIR